MATTSYTDILADHYERVWGGKAKRQRWYKGPLDELPDGFCVLEFAPDQRRDMWAYGTCGMSAPGDESPLELHLFSPVQANEHVELLTAIAHYHRNGAHLGVGHTVNFGRPWLRGSRCSYGLISRPYLDGPDLERCRPPTPSKEVRCLWLIPITPGEVQFKKARGLEALESLFEAAKINYVDPLRPDLAPM